MVEAAAARFLARHTSDDDTWPMPMRSMAERDGWAVWDGAGLSDVGLLGLLVLNPRDPEIPNVVIVADGLDCAERRAAIAHELGHFELGHTPRAYDQGRLHTSMDPDKSGPFARYQLKFQEAEADAFAAYVLIPDAAVAKYDTAAALALACGVPARIAQLRLDMQA